MKYKIYQLETFEIQSSPWAANENASTLLFFPGDSLPAGQESMLRKMMKAVGQDIDRDCMLCNIPGGQKVNLPGIMRFSAAPRLLFFGTGPELDTDIVFPVYRCMQLNGRSLLWSESLDQIEASDERKKALWRELKIMYNIGK